MSFVNRRYTKGVPFLSKMLCKRIRGVAGRLVREAVCSFAAFYCHILCFLRFFVFNWNASIFLAFKSSVGSAALRLFENPKIYKQYMNSSTFCRPVILQFLIATIFFVTDCKELKLAQTA